MFAVRLQYHATALTAANCHIQPLIGGAFLNSFALCKQLGCWSRNQRKPRFLYCITSQNTFIQCDFRMNCALAERCTVHPKTSCRASYGIHSAEKSAVHLATILQNVVCLQCQFNMLILLLQWRIVISAHIIGGVFLYSFSLYKQLECWIGVLRKLRLSFLFNSHNTFIQCQSRMNCALAERCTVRQASCRALYATSSRPTSWPVTLKPGKSACRATPVIATRRAPSSPIGGHSSSGPSPSTSSAPGCRALTTPVSGNANPFIPGLRRSGFLTYVSYENR